MTIKSDLGKFLYCSSLLENKVAEACEHIANLFDDKAIKCLLMYIARDPFKRAEYFGSMAELLSPGISICIEGCVKIWGELWLDIVKDAEKIRERAEIIAVDLNFLSKLSREN